VLGAQTGQRYLGHLLIDDQLEIGVRRVRQLMLALLLVGSQGASALEVLDRGVVALPLDGVKV
jgi:hypothetical protein